MAIRQNIGDLQVMRKAVELSTSSALKEMQAGASGSQTRPLEKAIQAKKISQVQSPMTIFHFSTTFFHEFALSVFAWTNTECKSY